jgi:CRISPR-associated endoribonuclease Cas6
MGAGNFVTPRIASAQLILPGIVGGLIYCRVIAGFIGLLLYNNGQEVFILHITIQINSHESKVLKLPLANLHLFQALLYSLLPPEQASFLHDEGYRVDGRPMKLFAMSWPLSTAKPRISDDKIEYGLPLRLVVSTPVLETLDGLVSGTLGSGELRVGHNAVFCESVEAQDYSVENAEVPDARAEIAVTTLSPITCYAQMQRQDGRKYTVYFDPRSADFSESIHNNLIRKFRALCPDRSVPSGVVTIRSMGRIQERVARFDDASAFPIKGWEGRFILNGPSCLLQVGLNCGLGAKNSSGWGCIITSK